MLFLNVGVEIGQLMFIAGALAIVAGARRIPLPPVVWNWRLPVYAIGAVASCWTIQRVAQF